MILNRKLFAAAEAQVSVSPGVSTGTESKISPEKGVAVVETRPAGTPAGSASETDLSALLDDDEGELELDGASDVAPPLPPAAPSKPELKEPVPPTTPAVEVKAPIAQPVTPPVVAPVAPVVPQPTQTREEQEAEWRKMRESAESQLLKTYELSKDDADALMVDPAKVFPKLAARIHLQAFEAAMDTVSRNVPGVIQAVLAQQVQATALKEQFFTKFPALRQHEDLAGKFIMAYRNAAGPQAQPDDIANQAGVAAYVHLKLPLDGLPGIVLPQPAAAPAAPAAPFTPAPTAAGAIPRATKPNNAFTQLAEEFIKDDSN